VNRELYGVRFITDMYAKNVTTTAKSPTLYQLVKIEKNKMEKYQIEAINEGRAIDCYAEPDKFREHIIENWGYLEIVDGFNEMVEEHINYSRKTGVRFWIDIDLNLMKMFLPLVPKYIKKCLEVSKNRKK
jgi:hypothetical protein